MLPKMTHISERVAIRCPYPRARAYLLERATRSIVNRETAAIDLVLVSFGHTSDPFCMGEKFTLRWSAQRKGPFPVFNGEIAIKFDGEQTTLELWGDYE